MENKFKGNIKKGKIAIKFLSDFSNVDADLLTASYADSTGGSIQIGHAEVAPGGFGEVSIGASKRGLLEILVDTGHEDESGRLQVRRGAKLHDDKPTKGPVRWVYTVIE